MRETLSHDGLRLDRQPFERWFFQPTDIICNLVEPDLAASSDEVAFQTSLLSLQRLLIPHFQVLQVTSS